MVEIFGQSCVGISHQVEDHEKGTAYLVELHGLGGPGLQSEYMTDRRRPIEAKRGPTYTTAEIKREKSKVGLTPVAYLTTIPVLQCLGCNLSHGIPYLTLILRDF